MDAAPNDSAVWLESQNLMKKGLRFIIFLPHSWSRCCWNLRPDEEGIKTL